MNHENGTTNINELIKKIDEKLEEINWNHQTIILKMVMMYRIY